MVAATISHTAITNLMVTNTAAGEPGIEWDRVGAATGTATTTTGITTMGIITMGITTMGITTTAAATAGVRLPPGLTARRRHRGPCRQFLGIGATIEYYRHPGSRSVTRWKKPQVRLGSR
jgi:GLTT repeat (6 copies)